MEIYSFDSMEEMMAAQQVLDSAAQQAILPTQREMKPGSWWVRPYDELGCFVFGYWPTFDEMVASEREAGATAQEAEYVRNHETGKAERGYMFGTAYSPIEPDGELGTTHVSVCWPISEGEFLNAKDNGWELGATNPNDQDTPLVAWWVVDLCERLADEIVDDVIKSDIRPYINMRTIARILKHKHWHEPKPTRTSLTADMVLEKVQDAEEG